MNYRPWHDHYDYCVPPTARYPRLAVHELLQVPANAYPEKEALIFEGKAITFWQLREHVLRMGNALGTIGIKKGDRVGIHLPTCPQYAIAYFAVLSLGAIVVNLNPLYRVDELAGTINNTEPVALFTIDTSLPTIRTLLQHTEIPLIIVTRLEDFSGHAEKQPFKALDLDEGWLNFSTLLETTSHKGLPRVNITPDDPALIQFTGGTTGIPKGAVLTHANMIAATLQFYLWLGPIFQMFSAERRSTLLVLPLFHIYGNLMFTGSIFACSTQIMMPRFQIDEVMETMAGFREITNFPAVPTMITAILNHPRTEELTLGKKLGLLGSGGAPLPVSLIEQIMDLGIFYQEGAGMTETAAMGHLLPVLGMKKPGSIGLPAPDMDVRLVDLVDGLQDVRQGEPGEIIFKGPNVTKGYWKNPEETAGQIRNGWLYTGDIAVRDEDGYAFIVDRKKDMIIAGGFNIYPREIDEVLYRHPKVKAAVAVGIPDEYRGETVKVFVVPKDGEILTEEELKNYCKEKLVAYKVPRYFEFRNELPQSAAGKVLRKVLKDEELAKKQIKK